MRKSINNPFIISGYISPEFFCDRKNETERILRSVSSKRNLTLISPRRIGKTGLLKHAKYLLERKKNPLSVIYVDLLPTMSGNEFLNVISTALLHLKNNEKNFLEKILTLLSHLKPRLTIDSLTGQPTVELKADNISEIKLGMEQIFQLFSEINNELVVILDEFQQIVNYPEKNIEHILRSLIQTFPKISFVFSGSNKHMLEEMFSGASRPFYQSSELMYLGPIQAEEYVPFIVEKFNTGGKIISEDNVKKILNWGRFHTYYVQNICNRLFEKIEDEINDRIINDEFLNIITEYEPLYSGYRSLLSKNQFSLLQAIAIEGMVNQPTSGKFIMKHNLNAVSSVKTSLQALIDKEMIYKSEEYFLIYDLFFSRWLEYRYSNN